MGDSFSGRRGGWQSVEGLELTAPYVQHAEVEEGKGEEEDVDVELTETRHDTVAVADTGTGTGMRAVAGYLPPMADRRRVLEKHLYRTLKGTCETWSLLQPGDRVMVALSGGKDSYTLLHLLDRLVPRLDFPVELVAVHLDQSQPGYDGRPLVEWLERRGGAFEILREDTYSEVVERTAPGGTYCAVCSRLRRGILYTAAERLGCTAIALGHHREDALETFLMNLFFAGKLQAMPARYVTDDGRFRVIRPMLDCDEERIAELASLVGFPILPCNLCGSQEGLQRERMAELLATLEHSHPHVRSVMRHALGNVRPTHLLDAEVLEAWETRPPHVRPEIEADAKPPRFEAQPVRRLPLVD